MTRTRNRFPVGFIVFCLTVSVTFYQANLNLNLVTAADRSGDLPPLFKVEGQPLAANLDRLLTALGTLGNPLPQDITASLKDAISQRDAQKIQELIDPLVLFVVHINPESRVKVRRGPATSELQQFGFTPVLIKILNESTVTKRLRMLSPQHGAVYDGVSKFSLQRKRSVELFPEESPTKHSERFLSVAIHEQPPMVDRLSGLEVEYAIGLILSTESGKREATIGFDLGDGEQDLGARGETAVLFTVKPAIATQISVRDHDGSPSIAALVIKDRQGRIYPPQPKRLAPDLFFQPQIYRADEESVLLPPGEFLVESSRGPEYWVNEGTLEVTSPGKSRFNVSLKRWIDPMEFGFYSGDHHIHAAGCSHYTSPTEGVTPEDMFRQVKGEGLNVGCVLTWGPCYRYQRQFFAPKPHDISEPLTLLKYDVEVSGFGSQSLGHVCLLNLQDQTYPGSEGTETKGWPTWTTPVMKWAKAQGGVTGYAHSASGLAIDASSASKRLIAKWDRDANGSLSKTECETPTHDVIPLLPDLFSSIDKDRDSQLSLDELTASHNHAADQLPNLAIPEMNGVGAMEVCVSTAEGACDFISAMDTRRIQEWNTWYHILNCGFPLKVSGETDFPCMSSRRVGQGRVYVHLDREQKLDFETWCRGVAAGRSYVSDGFAHAVDFRVNDVAPGYGNVKLADQGTVEIQAKVAFAPQTPEAVAQGTIVPAAGKRLVGDTVELHGPRSDRMIPGGDRLVEVIVNGHPVASQKVPSDGRIHDLKFDIKIDRSSWVALRQFPQLHTNPVNVLVGDAPIRASSTSARWCEDVIDLLWINRQKNISNEERDAAKRTFDKARATYRTISRECEMSQ
ncbi:MAG: hypothetical protein FJ267_00100 [Planctomycetes bacterium]|nr:hypothetical protein [Planctomycetota bacterium]